MAGIVRLWIEALLRRTAQGAELGDRTPRSRYAVAADEAVRLLTEAGRPAHAPLLRAADTKWREIGLAGGTRLMELATSLGLSDVAIRMVAALIAIEHDADLERACAYAWDDFTRKRPDVGFLIELVSDGDEILREQARAALSNDAPLRRYRVLVVGNANDTDTVPPARRTVRLTDRLIGHLLGEDALDPVLEGVAYVAPPATIDDLVLPAPVLALARRALQLTGAPRVLFHGSAGVGKAMLVRALAGAAGRSVLVVDAAELVRTPERLDERMMRVARETVLR
ncbi:MAG TPA: AAA family ATPase, partial [Kofleriaceae bacterium]